MPENETRERVEKVVTGSVTTMKPTKTSRLLKELISDDVDSIGEYLLTEVIIPTIKNGIDDLITNGLHMILWGTTAGKSSKNSSIPHVSYSKFYSQGDSRKKPTTTTDDRYDCDPLIFDNRADAEEVLNTMIDLIDTYQNVSILDLYDLVGKETNFAQQKYGWTSLGSARVDRVREGYLLKLPKPKLL